jgi:hypothetical protein
MQRDPRDELLEAIGAIIDEWRKSSVSQHENIEISGSWTIPRLTRQATPEETRSGLRQIPLLRGVTSFGMVNRLNGEVSICPERPIKIDSPLVDGFLIRRVLESMRGKHPDVSFEVESSLTGDLTAILVRGPLSDVQIRELTNASRWTFSKALDQETLR